MNRQLKALLCMIASALFAIAIDIWLLRTGGSPATMSVVIREWARDLPSVVLVFGFGFGALCGHFFLCPGCKQNGDSA